MTGGQAQAGHMEHITSKEELRALVSVREAHKEAEEEIFEMLASSGAILKGHFRLESGDHSTHFIRFDYLAGSRSIVERIAERLIKELKRDRLSFDAVLVQEHAGRVLGGTIAHKLGKRKVIAEVDDSNQPTGNLINPASLYRNDRVLVVVDMTTTGSALRRMTASVREHKAIPVAIALFAVRDSQAISNLKAEEGIPVYALVDLLVERATKPAESCEVCQGGRVPVSLFPSWKV